MNDELQSLVARLVAHRWIRRNDPAVRKVLTDETFRQDLEQRLSACGMRFLDNPYADHVAVGLLHEVEEPVFCSEEKWLSSNLGLPRDGVALLIVLWALLILPKRQKQIEAADREAEPVGQIPLFAENGRPKAQAHEPISIKLATLRADYESKLGGKVRLKTNLATLIRLGFIGKKDETIYEGPLLDLAIDYGQIAKRIFDGALSSLAGSRDTRSFEGSDVSV